MPHISIFHLLTVKHRFINTFHHLSLSCRLFHPLLIQRRVCTSAIIHSAFWVAWVKSDLDRWRWIYLMPCKITQLLPRVSWGRALFCVRAQPNFVLCFVWFWFSLQRSRDALLWASSVCLHSSNHFCFLLISSSKLCEVLLAAEINMKSYCIFSGLERSQVTVLMTRNSVENTRDTDLNDSSVLMLRSSLVFIAWLSVRFNKI